MRQVFNCRFCANCCLNLIDAYNGCVSDADLQRWRELGRSDLLDWVRTLDLGHGNQLHTAWVEPDSGEDVERCPWLLYRLDRQGYLCGIEAVKPDHCRAYPEHQNHAEITGCQGFQPQEKETTHER